MKMLFSTDKNGWPTRMASDLHDGEVPPGYLAFESLSEMADWQAKNAHLAPPPEPEWIPVPDAISLRQFLMAADRTGLLPILEALKIDPELPIQTRRDIYFFLEYSNMIERHHPLIVGLAPKVGVKDSDLDDLFRLGERL